MPATPVIFEPQPAAPHLAPETVSEPETAGASADEQPRGEHSPETQSEAAEWPDESPAEELASSDAESIADHDEHEADEHEADDVLDVSDEHEPAQ
ncbi:MAG TPA: hypothetical protein VIK18_02210 [Pirellulales bacterium]